MKESDLRKIIREEAQKIITESQEEWREIPGEDMDVLIRAGIGRNRIKDVERKRGQMGEGYDVYADFRKAGLPIRNINMLEKIGLQFIAIGVGDKNTARLEFRK